MTTETEDEASIESAAYALRAEHFDEVSDELEAVNRQLAESQAREAKCRVVLMELLDEADECRESGAAGRARATIATKPDGAALREFGLKVARETRDNINPREPDSAVVALVDAVLKGGA